MRIAGSKSGSVSFSVTLDSQLMLGKEVVGSKYIALKGQCPIDSNKVTEVASPTRSSKKQGMEFVAVLQVEVSGEAGRLQVVDKQTLKVHQADWAVLYLTASSSFDGPFKDPSISGIEPTSLAFAALANLVDLSFDDILAAHLADYQTLFHRVSLRLRNHRCIDGNPDSSVFEDVDNEEKDLGLWELIVPSEIVESKTVESGAQVSTGVDGEVYPQNAWKERISTRDRILNFDGDEDPDLVVLLFQFGRYLLIASSRPNSFVSNLQGVWSNSLHPAWR